MYADVRGRVGDVELLFLTRYRRAQAPARLLGAVRHRARPVVAQVTVAGAIRPGRSRRGPLSPSSGAGSDTVAAALRSAGRDDSVGAVVLRVDSPGGSYVASDVIWREVTQLRAAGKPVVASMGDVAASGGYFVAMGADAIVAQPGTITGSIGVFSGKVVTAGLLDRLGIGTDAVVEGRQARMFSPRVGFDDEQWRRLEEWLDRVYADFVGKVAEARGLTPGAGARAGPRSRVDRRGRVRAGAGRRARRSAPGGRAGPAAGRAAGGRRAAPVAAAAPGGPAVAAEVQRGPDAAAAGPVPMGRLGLARRRGRPARPPALRAPAHPALSPAPPAPRLPSPRRSPPPPLPTDGSRPRLISSAAD